jgi:hypothetical protein
MRFCCKSCVCLTHTIDLTVHVFVCDGYEVGSFVFSLFLHARQAHLLSSPEWYQRVFYRMFPSYVNSRPVEQTSFRYGVRLTYVLTVGCGDLLAKYHKALLARDYTTMLPIVYANHVNYSGDHISL